MGYKDGREYDYEELRRASRSPDPIIAKIARESGERIAKESGKIRSMREALIKAHRRGDVENIKDIHSFIQGKEDYQNR